MASRAKVASLLRDHLVPNLPLPSSINLLRTRGIPSDDVLYWELLHIQLPALSARFREGEWVQLPERYCRLKRGSTLAGHGGDSSRIIDRWCVTDNQVEV